MNWLITVLQKEARGRRYRAEDRVRFFSDAPKGKGKGVIFSPKFTRGRVVDFDGDTRRYRVVTDDNQEMDIHPRNIIPEGIGQRAPAPAPEMIDVSEIAEAEIAAE